MTLEEIEIDRLKAENEKLREALEQAEGKARLGAKIMRPDERGQHIADGFLVIADYCKAALQEGE